jgi:hypothetical protein
MKSNIKITTREQCLSLSGIEKMAKTYTPIVHPSPTRHAIVETNTYTIEMTETIVTVKDREVRKIIAVTQAMAMPIEVRADDTMFFRVS